MEQVIIGRQTYLIGLHWLDFSTEDRKHWNSRFNGTRMRVLSKLKVPLFVESAQRHLVLGIVRQARKANAKISDPVLMLHVCEGMKHLSETGRCALLFRLDEKRVWAAMLIDHQPAPAGELICTSEMEALNFLLSYAVDFSSASFKLFTSMQSIALDEEQERLLENPTVLPLTDILNRAGHDVSSYRVAPPPSNKSALQLGLATIIAGITIHHVYTTYFQNDSQKRIQAVLGPANPDPAFVSGFAAQLNSRKGVPLKAALSAFNSYLTTHTSTREGWAFVEVACKGTQCEQFWEREKGGAEFPRQPNEIVIPDDLDHVRVPFALAITPDVIAPPSSVAQIKSIYGMEEGIKPLTAALRSMKDSGMDMKPSPLTVMSVSHPAYAIAMGSWSLEGNPYLLKEHLMSMPDLRSITVEIISVKAPKGDAEGKASLSGSFYQMITSAQADLIKHKS